MSETQLIRESLLTSPHGTLWKNKLQARAFLQSKSLFINQGNIPKLTISLFSDTSPLHSLFLLKNVITITMRLLFS